MVRLVRKFYCHKGPNTAIHPLIMTIRPQIDHGDFFCSIIKSVSERQVNREFLK